MKRFNMKKHTMYVTSTMTKVLITSRLNDKILEHKFLVYEGCVIMMLYVPQEPKSGVYH